MDMSISNWMFETFGSNKVFLKIAYVLTYIGDKWTVIAILALLLAFKKTRKIGLYATVTVLITFSSVNYIFKFIIQRDRPFVQNPELLAVLKTAGHGIPDSFSMPSGHSATSMCLAVSILMFNRKFGIGAVALAAICGLTRIILCVHFLTDVLVGFAIGILFAVLIHLLMNKIIKNIQNKKEIKNEKNSSRNK